MSEEEKSIIDFLKKCKEDKYKVIPLLQKSNEILLNYIDKLNNELIKEMELFKNYFINDILQNESYMLSHIENYNLQDYYVCQLVIKFFEKGITDLDFIFKAIKEYKVEDDNNESKKQ